MRTTEPAWTAATATFTVTVANVAPDVTHAGGPDGQRRRHRRLFDLGSFTDPGDGQTRGA